MFPEDARRAIYDVIALRRDIRHFREGTEVADDVLDRILGAAHRAPSVGLSQPWGFILIRDGAQRSRIRESFLRCREAEAIRYPPERRAAYLAHRLEGILESALNVCVAVDLRSSGEAILGATAQPEAVRASACCAVQNLWLAARAEGVGVGWVSIVEPRVLRDELALPAGVEPVAYLCMGHPVAFRERPMLEESGWRAQRSLSSVVHPGGTWSNEDRDGSPSAAGTSPPRACARSAPSGADARAAAVAHLARLAKPIGSLGRIEALATWYAGAHATFPPPLVRRAKLAVFAADHGVVVEGVSAYGSQLTAATVINAMAGGAAVNVLCRENAVELSLVDVGITGDLSAAPTAPLVPLVSRKVRPGTANLRREPAMALADAESAIEHGREIAAGAFDSGVHLLGIGEIGIGNTTAAAALTCVFTGAAPSAVVGCGTGISEAIRERKVAVVEEALALLRPDSRQPVEALALVGGLEIAAMVGAFLEARRLRLPVVLDGFVTNAAALVAAAIDPATPSILLAAHRSPEPGASIALAKLGFDPVLDLGLRLGEGTGAAIGIGLVRASVATLLSMATFATAGIVGRPGTDVGVES